jgi:hypothetical protein
MVAATAAAQNITSKKLTIRAKRAQRLQDDTSFYLSLELPHQRSKENANDAALAKFFLILML